MGGGVGDMSSSSSSSCRCWNCCWVNRGTAAVGGLDDGRTDGRLPDGLAVRHVEIVGLPFGGLVQGPEALPCLWSWLLLCLLLLVVVQLLLVIQQLLCVHRLLFVQCGGSVGVGGWGDE